MVVRTARSALVAVLLLTLGLAAWCSAAPSPPAISPSFTANVQMSTMQLLSEGFLQYDVTRQLMNLTLSASFFQIPKVENLFQENTTQVVSSNGQCRYYPSSPFPNMFGWLPHSSYEGKEPCPLPTWTANTLRAQMCEQWSWTDPEDPTKMTFRLYALPAQNVPIMLTIGTPKKVQQTWVFNTFVPGPIHFEKRPTCPPPSSCGDGNVEKMVMYRFHEPGDYSLANQNTGDLLGDTAFICYALLNRVFMEYHQVSAFLVQVNKTWGQYAMCNYGHCIGGDNTTVGRGSSFGLDKRKEGQCSSNEEYGNWYSLPAGGECKKQELSRRGGAGSSCSWQNGGKIKTVGKDCLVERGFMLACLSDSGYPLPSAQKILQNAIAKDDPNQGGCPPIEGATSFPSKLSSSFLPSSPSSLLASLSPSSSFSFAPFQLLSTKEKPPRS
ncbi:hypothetical protein QOT17_000366 [Balamuthia mandrillaris]